LFQISIPDSCTRSVENAALELYRVNKAEVFPSHQTVIVHTNFFGRTNSYVRQREYKGNSILSNLKIGNFGSSIGRIIPNQRNTESLFSQNLIPSSSLNQIDRTNPQAPHRINPHGNFRSTLRHPHQQPASFYSSQNFATNNNL